jgi:hypothetical protein
MRCNVILVSLLLLIAIAIVDAAQAVLATVTTMYPAARVEQQVSINACLQATSLPVAIDYGGHLTDIETSIRLTVKNWHQGVTH